MLTTLAASSGRSRGFGARLLARAGQQAFTTPGTYSWVAPAGVTSVSVVCVGAGGGGGGNSGQGGGLGWKNNITVVPGQSYTVVVGAGGFGTWFGTSGTGGTSYFISDTTVAGKGGQGNGAATVGGEGTYVGDGGGNAGSGAGGGAGGYTGNGGTIGSNYPSGPGSDGSGGGGAGGAGTGEYYVYDGYLDSVRYYGFGGGGVGILGQGSNGVGAAWSQGGAGSVTGSQPSYGGSGHGAYIVYLTGWAPNPYNGGPGSGGAVRIIWAGDSGITRAFPSTNTGDIVQ